MKNNSKKEPVILKDNGSEFSEVANEVERTYLAWLSAAQWQEEALLSEINSDSFELQYDQTSRSIEVTLQNDNGVICTPLCWVNRVSSLSKHEFKLDCALVLLYIAAKEIAPASVQKIKGFIRSFLM